jgi:hypothetical protein
MLVRCIDNEVAARSLTVGKVYEVIEVTNNGKNYKIIDDRGMFWYPLYDRFVVVEKE